jgi:adenine-specific DNA-methyltransferase
MENEEYLTKQLITYIGNKRSLLNFIGSGVDIVKKKLNKNKLDCFDVFSGSGVVSRFLKQYSNRLVVNDFEPYAKIINECYLSNKSELNLSELKNIHAELTHKLSNNLHKGFISELYAPKELNNIQAGERCFYTPRNAEFIDSARQEIELIPKQLQKYFIAPLLSEASIHNNTSGVFKGFYKNSTTGIGKFGGDGENALSRILGNIELKFPVFSNFDSDTEICIGDSNKIVDNIDEVDLAYLDPPYNQHPYGSNYFLLNLITNYKKPQEISKVSGITKDWFKSNYNKKQLAYKELSSLVEKIKAKYLLISFNSDGFINKDEMMTLLNTIGKTEVLETKYNTFKGSRNLNNRDIYVTEYLFLVEKK